MRYIASQSNSAGDSYGNYHHGAWIFLTRVVADNELPFAVKAPNARSRAAMAEAGEIIKNRRALFNNPEALIDDLEKASRK